jgi:hypothetical protein
VVPLTLGGIIYLLFRSSDLRMFDWLDILGIKSAVLFFRMNSQAIKESIPDWTYYSLPDGLWVYAFTSSLILFWRGHTMMKNWLLLPFIFGVIVEILQLLKLFPGTFDSMDFLFTLSAYICSIYILRKNFIHETEVS